MTLTGLDALAYWLGYAVLVALALAAIFAALSVSAMYTEQQTQQAQHAAIEADRKRTADWHRIADERAAEIVRLTELVDRKRGSEPVAYRLLRKNADGEWVTDGRPWCDGVPDADLVKDSEKSGQYRIEYAFAAPQPAEPGQALAAQAQQPVSGAESLPGFRVDLDEAQEDRLKTWVGHAEASPWRQSVTRLALLLNTTKRGLIDYDAAHHFAQELMTRTGRAALAQQDAEPVYQFRKKGCADWYDGYPDHTDGGGPYETRTLYATPQPAEPVSQHPDDAAVDAFAATMKAKLAKKRAEGRGGWQMCSAGDLSRLLREHVEKGDPVDVANLAMMLSQNGQRIEATEPVKEETVDLGIPKSCGKPFCAPNDHHPLCDKAEPV